MPKWIHNRAEHIRKKNPAMPESEAFAIATQQSHALGKSPKGFGTEEGKEKAKAKYKNPKKMQKKAEEEKGLWENGGKQLLGGYAGGLGSMGGVLASNAVLKKQLGKELAADPVGANSLIEKLKSDASVPVESGHSHMFDLDKKRVILGPNATPSALAHELGHADISNNRLGRLIQNSLTHRLGVSAPMVGLASGVAAGFSDDEGTRRIGLIAPLAASAPQLAYEAGASIQGLRRLHRAGASRGQMLSAAKSLLPAFGTYAALAGAGVASAAQGQGLVRMIRSRNVDDGQAKSANLHEEIAEALNQPTSLDKVKNKFRSEAQTVADNPTASAYLNNTLKLAAAEFNGMIDELVKEANLTPPSAAVPTKMQKFMQGVKGEAGPAIGATLGAGVAKAYGVDPLAGAAAGYGLGAIPEVIHALRTRAKVANFAAYSAYGGNQAQNPPGMRQASPGPSFTEPPLHVKKAFQTSQYSGPLSYGPFKMTSGIPAFKNPAMTKFVPEAGEEQAWMAGGDKQASLEIDLSPHAARMLGLKTAASMNTATGAMSPAAKLSTTQNVGAPKTSGFAGPSIADVAKPHGFGNPLPGATKNRI